MFTERPWPVRLLAAVGLVLGAASVVAGTRVLAGIDRPDYVVLPWLVTYNVTFGLLGIAAAIGVWARRAWGRRAAQLLGSVHAAVLLLLAMRLAGPSAAIESIAAMSVRTAVWLLIGFLAPHPPPRREARHSR